MKAIKTIFYLAAAWGLISLGSACNKNQAPTPEITLSAETAQLSSSGIQVNAAENVKHLVFSSATEWSITAMDKSGGIAGWVAVYPANGKGGSAQVDAEMVIGANPLLTAREATVSLVSGSIVKTFEVKQAARAEVPVTGVEILEDEVILHATETYQLHVEYDPDNADVLKGLVWSSSDESVATVENGLVKALAVGEAVITATYDTFSSQCVVKVGADVISIRLNMIAFEILEDETFQLVATITPEGVLDEVGWVSMDPSIATVEEGLVTGIHQGSTVIVATIGNLSKECKVTVTHRVIEVESVTLAEHEKTIEQGSSFKIDVEVNPSNADDTTLVWSSSNPEVVNVNAETGQLYALEPGSAVITVTSVNGKTDTCTVTVTPKDGSHGENLNPDIDVDPWN